MREKSVPGDAVDWWRYSVRRILIVAAVLCGVLALAGVASAALRDVPAGSGEPAVVETPSSLPSDVPSSPPAPAPSELPAATDSGDQGTVQTEAVGNHGAAVSAVAQDDETVASKTLANGKTITNHGVAVSAVARSQAGKPEASTSAGTHGKARGHGKQE